jgi:O-6-methylguanine DNA methyltransferase
MQLYYHVMKSPLGLLFLSASDRGLCAVHYMDKRSLKRTLAKENERYPGAAWTPSLVRLKNVVDQLNAYFLGTLTDFRIPVDPVGKPFQMRVWEELRKIPYGETRSYGEIAKLLGQPRSARAVGLANHDNPIAIIVPCHRVVGADGRLTGYGGGLPRKRWLLQHEAQQLTGTVPRQGDLFARV